MEDTIVAISTPVGEGGIGIVRLSGPDARSIADKIFIGKDKQRPSGFKTYTTHYGWIVANRKSQIANRKNDKRLARSKERIDEVILTVMRAPRSYTREDIVEINCHGGIVPLREVLDLTLRLGARIAQPGEFTKRAFLNGRIDLSQAEAVLDVIRAKTKRALELGVGQLKGELSTKINGIRERLLELLAHLEADIDFPEEEIEALSFKQLSVRVKRAMLEIKDLLDSSQKGKILREGISIVICGKPNAGKSSLLNTLLKEDRAIVTSVPGTTRDVIEEVVDINGIPFKLADTAGILEPKDLIEKEAVSRSEKAIKEADLVILLFDGSRPFSSEDNFLMQKTTDKNVINVVNKIDLPQRINLSQLKAKNKQLDGIVKISALRGNGLDGLQKRILGEVWKGKIVLSDEILVSNLRHIDALRRAYDALNKALMSIQDGLSAEFVTLDLKEGINFLGEITGSTLGEDLLDKIFSEFCIGK